MSKVLERLMEQAPANLYKPLAPGTYKLLDVLRRARQARLAARTDANAVYIDIAVARIDALAYLAESGEYDVLRSTRAYPIEDLARALDNCALPQVAHAARRGVYGAPEPRRCNPPPIGTPRRAQKQQ